MIDSHCHLADEAFLEDLPAVIERARAAGLTAVLCVVDVSNPAEGERAQAAAALWDGVWTTAGVHPHTAGAYADRPARSVELVAQRVGRDPRVRAIGEIGLDYHYDFAPRDVQREVFAAQVAFAREAGLPVVVHTREADEDTLQILEHSGRGDLRGVFHCFSGGPKLARRAVALGFHVSFSGILTFPNALAVREAAREVPVDRLLVETDSPYLAPVPLRGKRNEPASVVLIARELARLRDTDETVCAATIVENFRTLFRP